MWYLCFSLNCRVAKSSHLPARKERRGGLRFKGRMGLVSRRPHSLKRRLSKYWRICCRPVYEVVNECQAGNSPPDTGGVAAPLRKRCEATAAAQTGVVGIDDVFHNAFLEEVPFWTTPSAPLKEASRLLLDVASNPPMSGGEWHAQFTHTFLDT